MGYGGELVSHGFRALGSTMLNEAGFPPDVTEAALPHTHSSSMRAAYNRITHLEQRTGMMNQWDRKSVRRRQR
ncbi:hypothetical protein LU604_18195 [Erwinia tracheiphila]|uniref:Integrase n=1 Tax=Erwinia tracheiphila TaxID=65700 RepID=A0A345CNJ3_9GAMM|nr:hypothetical protein [Erwinia tracheiphila]AXF75010.1 hypothetical protein AV903_01010 [Erwinia tracheiphila]UIA82451.1 hypothetical protein LU604_18195 [Erwinia tracheiphila]UIA91040.1 hypothetical protein LU632_17740 [Erwinia tracheiphila]